MIASGWGVGGGGDTQLYSISHGRTFFRNGANTVQANGVHKEDSGVHISMYTTFVRTIVNGCATLHIPVDNGKLINICRR